MAMLELPSCGVGSKVRGAATAEEGAEVRWWTTFFFL